MIIENLFLKNFRGFSEIKIDFDENFNLIIGDNGSGKTAIIEALNVAIGTFFLGIKNTSSRNIHKDDIRIKIYNDNEEYQFPIVIETQGVVNEKNIKWKRELTYLEGKTKSINASKIIKEAKELDRVVREGKNVKLPLLAFYSTGRLFNEIYPKKESKRETKKISSRFRAYQQALNSKSTFRIFQQWFKAKEMSIIQKGEDNKLFTMVKQAVIDNIPNCKNIYFELDPDKFAGLKIDLKDNRTLPFYYLSDGTRNYLALIADLAHKCVTLNPGLEFPIKETKGVVLIDELDLHLHPDWQRKIVKSLTETFPNLQFITSSHSPFLIQETEIGQLIKLTDNQVTDISGANDQSIEDIAEFIQDVKNPQWSRKKLKMYETAQKYFKAIQNNELEPELEQELNAQIKPFTSNPAYQAIIEQYKIINSKK